MNIDILKFDPPREISLFYDKFKTTLEAWESCQTGEYLFWLCQQLDFDKKKLIGCAGECAATVKHLLKDKCSLDALEACARYAAGKIGKEELWEVRNKAEGARCAHESLTCALSHAPYMSATYASHAASYSTGFNDSFENANKKLTADIVRRHFTQDLIEYIEKCK